MADSSREQRRSQSAAVLAELLEGELRIARSMLITAKIKSEEPKDSTAIQQSIATAQVALAKVLRFLPQLRQYGAENSARDIEEEARAVRTELAALIDFRVGTY